jgi:predicted flap endonuclease-1-like 5' DNA nuclease
VTWFALQSLFLILGAFVLGVLVGWLVWGRQERQERIVVLHGDGTAPRAATRHQQAPATATASAPDTGTWAAQTGDAPADDEPHWLRARPADSPATATGPATGPSQPSQPTQPTPAAGGPGVTPDVVDLRDPAPDVVDLRDEAAAAGSPTGTADDAGDAPAGPASATDPARAAHPDDAAKPADAAAGTGTGAAGTATPTAEPRDPDDLSRIEGVTPKIETALQENGITSYERLATCDEFRLRSILRNAGLRFTPTLTSWPEQADLLARGDDEGFAVLSARVAADHRAAGTA